MDTNSYYHLVRIRIRVRRNVMEDSFEAIRRLMIAINKIDGCYYFCARKLGVKENMLALLYALDDGKPHSQKQIYEDWLIPKTTISTIVKELVKEGYITLLAEEESREKTILLTESGKEYTRILLEKFYTTEQEALKNTLQKFSPGFIDAFDCFASCLCAESQKHILDQNE